MSARRGRPPHPDVLTPAEWRIVEAIRHGMSNSTIATRRGISREAVKFHLRNVLPKLGLETRGDPRHWAGRASGSAGVEARGTIMTHDISGIGQIARTVRDIEVATTWYRDILGLTHLYSFDRMAFFDCGGVRLFLSASEGASDGQSILYFRVADIWAATETLKGRGVDLLNAPHMIHRHQDGLEEWMVFFKDNEGRPLALMSQLVPATG